MDDFIKEPDKYDFVDSDHILNYLKRTMEEGCDSSLLDCGEGIDDSMDGRLDSTAGLLDNLIKTVCDGIDESTLIDKDSNIDSSVIVEAFNKDDSIDSSVLGEDVGNYKEMVFNNDDSIDGSVRSDTTCNTGDSSNFVTAGRSGIDSSKQNEDSKEKTQGNEIDLATTDEEGDSCEVKKISSDKHGQRKESPLHEVNEEENNTPLANKETLEEVVVISDDEESKACEGKDLDGNDSQTQPSELQKLDICAPKATSSPNKRQTSEHAFFINDNMKKGLSNLAFPSKSSTSRITAKKNKPLNKRTISNTRITIGEALEKAQDAASKFGSESDFGKNYFPLHGRMMKIGSSTSEEAQVAWVSIGGQPSSSVDSTIDKVLSDAVLSFNSSRVDSPSSELSDNRRSNTSPSSLTSGESVVPLDSEGQEVGVEKDGKMDKNEEKQTMKEKTLDEKLGRFRLSVQMWKLLRFTFDHEHFPSSVHMARLGKMMGITWIRNWFTNRRVQNKKAGIFPRDKVLLYCPYCKVYLNTESEQKGHLFSSPHVRKILGHEYVGQSDLEAIKWKQRSQEVNVNKESKSDSAKDQPPEEQDFESVTKTLGNRWKNSFLVESEFGASAVVKSTEMLVLSKYNDGAKSGDKRVRDEMDEFSASDTSQGIHDKYIKTEDEENSPNRENLQNFDISSLNVAGVKVAHSPVIPEFRSNRGFRNINTTPNYLVSSSNASSMVNMNSLSLRPRKRQRRYDNSLDDSTLGYQCPTCFKIFQTEWQMMKHSMTHLLFICDICANIFPSEHILKLHLHDHLTGQYEEEKYYCQFSCRVCHSLKCECYEPIYYKPADTPKTYSRPQKAIRSKKTFATMPFSGPNDHLRVAPSSYQKYVLQDNQAHPKEILGGVTKQVTGSRPALQTVTLIPVQKPIQKQDETKTRVDSNKKFNDTKSLEISKLVQTTFEPSAPRLSVRKDLIQASPVEDTETAYAQSEIKASKKTDEHKSEQVTSPDSVDNSMKENEPRKGRPRTQKSGNSTKIGVYNDFDFYYMCEICDSSFVSKSDLQNHMFLHRFKSSSSLMGKRRLDVSTSKESKRRAKGSASNLEDETANAISFDENFRCEECGGYFACVSDLKRHIKQAHSKDLFSKDVLKCNYCDKLYRRERELRRHLKHACESAPVHLKTVLLATNANLYTLEKQGEGPHFTSVDRKVAEQLRKEATQIIPKGPYRCKYCPLVTKREAEMKRHIWMNCAETPKRIKDQCRQGCSLEELGFTSEGDETKDEEKESLSSTTKEHIYIPSEDVLKCNYCEKLYRRERELRRHLKQACATAPERLKSVLSSTSENLYTLYNQGEGPHFTTVDRKAEMLKRTEIPVIVKGPFKCRYCPLVTRREREMKRHIWMKCVKTPQIIRRRCKEGCSLEDLGFLCDEDEVKDMLSNTSKEEENDVKTNESDLSATPDDVLETSLLSQSDSQEQSPTTSGSTSITSGIYKLPFVCAYCGIWYYREVSVARHMKERCICIPSSHRECLLNGGSLCDTVSNAINNKVLKNAEGVYKMVAIADGTGNIRMPSDLPPKEVPAVEASDEKYVQCFEGNVPVVQIKENKIDPWDTPGPSQSKKNIRNTTRCNRCHETFISIEAVLAHSSVHHGPKKGFYKCKLCCERFQKYKQLREHVWEHTQETPYKCHICEAKFRLSDLLVEHLQSIHAYTSIYEKNLYKWLPGRNGKYRVLETSKEITGAFDNEETLEGLETNLDSLAEDMVVTDDLWSERNDNRSQPKGSPIKSGKEKKDKENIKRVKTEQGADNESKIEDIQFKKPNKPTRSDSKETDSKQSSKKSNATSPMSMKTRRSKQKEKNEKETTSPKANAKEMAEPEKKKVVEKNQKSYSPRKTSPGKMREQRSNSGDEDDLLLGSLESIIETVNLTDDSFLD